MCLTGCGCFILAKFVAVIVNLLSWIFEEIMYSFYYCSNNIYSMNMLCVIVVLMSCKQWKL